MSYLRTFRYVVFLFLLLCSALASIAQTSAFNYQGRLQDAGAPANGTYDFQFRLFDALVGGNQVGTTLLRDDVIVVSGVFTVSLNFGAAAFPGAARFLEIGVRPGASELLQGFLVAVTPLFEQLCYLVRRNGHERFWAPIRALLSGPKDSSTRIQYASPSWHL